MLKVKLDASLRLGRDALYPVPLELLALLRSIRQHGSLIYAIKEVGISHRHASGMLGRWGPLPGTNSWCLFAGKAPD